MIVCAGDIEQFEFAEPVGVGLVAVAINLTRLCIEKKPKEILFVGTAGSYGNIDLMEIVSSQKACQIEHSFLRSDAYSPIDNLVESIGNVSHETLVNSSNYITTNKEISEKYLAENIELENMEFYAVAQVAKSFDIPVKGIFIVTNYCDKNAHKKFLDNHKMAVRLLSKHINTGTI